MEPLRLTRDATLEPAEAHLLDRDPRGIVWQFEAPKPGATYAMGIDPTGGITGWDRSLRTQDDLRIDNGAIEIIRKGKSLGNNTREPDVQVCEYAAPIDPYELATVSNALGRLYGGNNEDGQALAIIEIFPGPGLPTQREMINRYGYTHLFVWRYLDTLAPSASKRPQLGWTSSDKSVRDLWIRGSRHIINRQIKINSTFLVEELTDCEVDPVKMHAKAVYGKHDDRVRAIMMAIWAVHDWALGSTDTIQTGADVPRHSGDWQSGDISYEDMMEEWNAGFSGYLE